MSLRGDIYDALAPTYVPVASVADRLEALVQAKLAEQREAIADALIDAQRLHPDNAFWCQDLDQAARIVRDFGKDGAP